MHCILHTKRLQQHPGLDCSSRDKRICDLICDRATTLANIVRSSYDRSAYRFHVDESYLTTELIVVTDAAIYHLLVSLLLTRGSKLIEIRRPDTTEDEGRMHTARATMPRIDWRRTGLRVTYWRILVRTICR